MKLLGGILMAIGLLIAGLSGLCSLTLIGSSLGSVSVPQVLPGLIVVGVVGGVPFAGGIALFIAGRSIARNASGAGKTTPPPRHNPTARPAHRLDEDD